MASRTLLDLYKTEPAAKNAIEKAEGYAVISDFGFKMGIMGGVHGHGVAIHNTTQQETFLNMAELQPGLGVGAEKFHVVLLFESSEAFNKLITSGWEFGADAMAVAKTKSAGGASSGAVIFSEGVKIYQLDEKGFYLVRLREDIQADPVKRYTAMIHELTDLVAYLETKRAEISDDSVANAAELEVARSEGFYGLSFASSGR